MTYCSIPERVLRPPVGKTEQREQGDSFQATDDHGYGNNDLGESVKL